MTDTLQIKSFDSEIIYDSEESAMHNESQNSFLDKILEKDLEEDS